MLRWPHSPVRVFLHEHHGVHNGLRGNAIVPPQVRDLLYIRSIDESVYSPNRTWIREIPCRPCSSYQSAPLIDRASPPAAIKKTADYILDDLMHVDIVIGVF